MNYIKRLQLDLAIEEANGKELAAGLNDLRAYLTSDKFHNDPTVQVADVLRRLDEIESFLRQTRRSRLARRRE